ncbi:MAG: tetratricopeptide repeat protein [Candidatus Cyclonatronum sp.]|uniref:tetratricopeptide repeat protein n=1 Tax=Cyclonatronum sp. TaxID=3024185 RepID=UPI0025BA3FE3|nr:tetratricopeptide repeat protein [Cyclonatronum sp.]MCC5932626.1 tetratricopeptide repeat protein [Balneolales bacterium]MCH8486010.1 tetratricopeptide repeat protein [Cyclonatronum sp.]
MTKETLLPWLLDNRELNKSQQKALKTLCKQIIAKSNNDKDAEDWFILGVSEQRDENYEEALDAFTFAVEKNPEFEAAYKFRAETHIALEDNDAALEDANKALELDNTYTEAYLVRSMLLRNRKAWDEALADADEAIRHDPENDFALLQKAKLLYDSGKYPESIEAFSAILEEDPQQIEALSSRGLAYFFEGDAEAALRDIKKARTLETGSVVSEFNMGLIMSALPDYTKQAFRHFEKAFRKDRKLLSRYIEMSEDFESERLVKRLDEILTELEGRKEGNFYALELYDLLDTRMKEVKALLASG